MKEEIGLISESPSYDYKNTSQLSCKYDGWLLFNVFRLGYRLLLLLLMDSFGGPIFPSGNSAATMSDLQPSPSPPHADFTVGIGIGYPPTFEGCCRYHVTSETRQNSGRLGENKRKK